MFLFAFAEKAFRYVILSAESTSDFDGMARKAGLAVASIAGFLTSFALRCRLGPLLDPVLDWSDCRIHAIVILCGLVTAFVPAAGYFGPYGLKLATIFVGAIPEAFMFWILLWRLHQNSVQVRVAQDMPRLPSSLLLTL